MRLIADHAECWLVASILFDPSVADVVGDVVKPVDFGSEWGKAYAMQLEMRASGSEMDVIDLADRLSGRTGDPGWLMSLTEACKTHIKSASNPRSQAKVIADYARMRRLEAVASEIQRIAHHPDMLADDKVEKAQNLLVGMQKTAVLKDLHSQIKEWVFHLEECSQSEGGVTGVKTGFAAWDEQTRGLHGGELVIIAARPAMGKTNFALNILNSVIQEGGKVAMFSLEMASRELLSRLCAIGAQIPYKNVLSGRFTDQEYIALGKFIERLQKAPMVIDDDAGVSLSDIRSRAREIRRSLGGLDSVLVDYLQLIPGDGESRRLEIEAISRGLKLLAKELNCPVVALSQLSRRVEERMDKRPILSDLRESGSIEQDADVVTMLYREGVYDPLSPDAGLVEVITRKLRHGETGTVYFEDDFGRCGFRETARRPAPRAKMTKGGGFDTWGE